MSTVLCKASITITCVDAKSFATDSSFAPYWMFILREEEQPYFQHRRNHSSGINIYILTPFLSAFMLLPDQRASLRKNNSPNYLQSKTVVDQIHTDGGPLLAVTLYTVRVCTG